MNIIPKAKPIRFCFKIENEQSEEEFYSLFALKDAIIKKFGIACLCGQSKVFAKWLNQIGDAQKAEAVNNLNDDASFDECVQLANILFGGKYENIAPKELLAKRLIEDKLLQYSDVCVADLIAHDENLALAAYKANMLKDPIQTLSSFTNSTNGELIRCLQEEQEKLKPKKRQAELIEDIEYYKAVVEFNNILLQSLEYNTILHQSYNKIEVGLMNLHNIVVKKHMGKERCDYAKILLGIVYSCYRSRLRIAESNLQQEVEWLDEMDLPLAQNISMFLKGVAQSLYLKIKKGKCYKLYPVDSNSFPYVIYTIDKGIRLFGENLNEFS